MVRIDSRDPDFATRFAHLLTLKREIAEDVDDAVRKIIADVVETGDDALVAYTRRFDRLGDDFSAARLRIGLDEYEAVTATTRIVKLFERFITAPAIAPGDKFHLSLELNFSKAGEANELLFTSSTAGVVTSASTSAGSTGRPPNSARAATCVRAAASLTTRRPMPAALNISGSRHDPAVRST